MENAMIKPFVGKIIKIDRGGTESRIGKLMEINDDHLILYTEEDGIVYYQNYHIKSVTENVKNDLNLNDEVPEDIEYKNVATLERLLDSLKYQWIRINRGGPEKLEGVLIDVKNDYISLINQEEIVRISMFHIRNLSDGEKIEEAEEVISDLQNESKRYDHRDSHSNNQWDYQRGYDYQDSTRTELENQRVTRNSNGRQNEETLTKRYSVRTSKKTVVEDELSELLSSMEKYIRNVSTQMLIKYVCKILNEKPNQF